MMSHFADLFIEATRKPIVTVLAGAINSETSVNTQHYL